MKPNDEKGARIGVIVGKSVHKTAVKRNFWKRQARSVLQASVRSDHDAILILHPQVSAVAKKIFREELERAVKSFT